ncbi:MAG: exo-alpha-sialidase [Acidobacteria bacterium]|nr:exo-alpha-sialidase [Acidobacteriota bacterium]
MIARFFTGLLLIIWTTSSSLPAQHASGDIPPMRLSNTPGRAFGAELTVTSRGQVLATWSHVEDSTEEVFFRRSSDGGKTFSPMYQLSKTPDGFSLYSSIAATDRGKIYVAWARSAAQESPAIMLRSSRLGGLLFSEPRCVSLLNSFPPEPKVVAGPQGFVGVVWTESTGSAFELYFTRSADGGHTFTSPALLERRYRILHQRAILNQQGTIHVVWAGRDPGEGRTNVIFLSRSTDGGLTFSTPVRLTSATAVDTIPAYPQVAASGEAVYVAWTDVRSGQIQLRRSQDNGLTFDPPLTVAPQSGASPFGLGISESGTVYLAYFANGAFEVIRSENGGGTFEPVRRLPGVSQVSGEGLRMAVGSRELMYLLWVSGSGHGVRTFFARVDGQVTP